MKQYTITSKIDKNKDVILKNLPFAPGDEVEITVKVVSSSLERLEVKKNIEKEDDTFISDVKMVSESLSVDISDIEEDDFATFMGEVKPPEIEKKSFLSRLTGSYKKNDILPVKPVTDKEIKKNSLWQILIRFFKGTKKHKEKKGLVSNKSVLVSTNKIDRIINRKYNKKIHNYYNAAFHILLDHNKINSSPHSASHKFPEKYMAPNTKGEMEFCSKKDAIAKNGIKCDVQINKQVLEVRDRQVITQFLDRYEDKSFLVLSEIAPDVFHDISSIMEQRQSKWKGVFRFPYRIQQGKTEEVIDSLGKRKNSVEPRLQKMVDDIILFYKNNFQNINFRDIAKVQRFFNEKEKDTLFIDMRKRLKIEEILPVLNKILNRMQMPYYNLFLRAELLSKPSTTYNHRPVSFGIVKIPVTEKEIFRKKMLHSNLKKKEYATKFEGVVTGKKMHEEAHFNKNEGGQRKELEELMIPFDDLKIGKSYASFDRKIKGTMLMSLLMGMYLFFLSLLMYMGKIWFMHIPIANEHAPLIIYSILTGMGCFYLGTTILLRVRRGRYFTILLAAFSITLLSYLLHGGLLVGEKIYFLYMPWIIINAFILLRLLNPGIKPHFYREFGSVHAKPSPWSVVTIICITSICIMLNLLYFFEGSL